MSDEKIIERIRRLLSLAEDAGSPNEAMIAARRARSLMDKHQLSKLDIERAVGSQFLETTSSVEGKVRRRWIGMLSSAAGIINDCVSLSSGAPCVRYFFQGFKSDAIVAKLTMEYLVETCERLCKTANLFSASEKNYYRVGFASAVLVNANRLAKEREALKTSSGKELVLCKKTAIVEHFGDYPSRRPAPVRPPSEDERNAYLIGHRDGSNTNLDRQVQTKKHAKICAS